jgi:hypothetical protein
MLKGCRTLSGRPSGIALDRTFPGQLLQRLLRRQRGIVALFRILVGEFVEAEAATFDDLECPRHGFGVAREEPVHFVRRLEKAIGMALAPTAEVIDRDIVADRRHHVVQDASAGFVEQYVVGHDSRHPHLRRQVRKLMKPELVIGPAAQRQRHIGSVTEDLPQAAQAQRAVVVGDVGNEDGDKALTIDERGRPIRDGTWPCRRGPCPSVSSRHSRA